MTNIRYEDIPIEECGEPLLDMSQFDFVLDPAYFKAGLSPTAKLFSRKSIIEKLLKIQTRLTGLRFKIWDPWRPREVQANIYKKYWDELVALHPNWNDEELTKAVGVFVSSPHNPARIPPHASGGAIDLTLVDASNCELDMGTGFDHFGPESASLYFEQPGLSTQVRDNRRLLRENMLAEDFRLDSDEWWHFDYGNQLWALKTGKKVAIYGERFTAG